MGVIADAVDQLNNQTKQSHLDLSSVFSLLTPEELLQCFHKSHMTKLPVKVDE